jgi:hypothetical protein
MTKKAYTNQNETGSYSIEYATNWSPGNDVEISLRIIVMKYLTGHHALSYAVRWQNRQGDTFGGYSFEGKETAHNYFLKKYLDHNASYRKGNPSHLPGMNTRV